MNGKESKRQYSDASKQRKDNNGGTKQYANKKNSKGKYKDNSRDKRESSDQEEMKSKPNDTFRNDPDWYAISEGVGKAIGSLAFNKFPGTLSTIVPSGLSSNIVDETGRSVPGVMAIKYVSVPGASRSATSAVNVAARAVYSWVRHQNSGSKNYESPDLMIYILAMSQIYLAYFEAVRVYRLARTYEYSNRNMPNLLLSALNVDLNQINGDISNFRGRLNNFAGKLSSMCVPNTFKLFLRQALLAQGVWCDSTSTRSQYYIPDAQYYLRYDATGSTTGGRLIPQPKSVNETTNLRTTDTIIKDLESMWNYVSLDEDMNIMSGDIKKAYGSDLYAVPEVNEEDTQPILFDENILSQIENLFAVDIESINVSQEDGSLICDPYVDVTDPSFNLYSCYRYFNSHKDDPDWKDTLEWTRFAMCSSSDTTTSQVHFDCGSELVTSFTIYYYKYTGTGVQPTIESIPLTTMMEVDSWTSDRWPNTLGVLSKFDWHPIVYLYGQSSLSAPTDLLGIVGDFKVFTLISNETISTLHDSATTTELTGNLLKI